MVSSILASTLEFTTANFNTACGCWRKTFQNRRISIEYNRITNARKQCVKTHNCSCPALVITKQTLFSYRYPALRLSDHWVLCVCVQFRRRSWLLVRWVQISYQDSPHRPHSLVSLPTFSVPIATLRAFSTGTCTSRSYFTRSLVCKRHQNDPYFNIARVLNVKAQMKTVMSSCVVQRYCFLVVFDVTEMIMKFYSFL